METNKNLPSEKDITSQELDALSSKLTEEFMKDEFPGLSGTPINMEPFHPKPSITFCGIDLDALLANVPKQPPIEWSTGAWNGPLIELDPNNPFGHMEQLFSSGIHITSITPPENGWPVAMYCPICKVTTFVLSPWAIKPEKRDYFKMNDMCADEVKGFKHNMQLGMKGYNAPIYLKPGKIGFMLYDPLPPESIPSMIEFTQKMNIEEAKRRYPDAKIPGEETK